MRVKITTAMAGQHCPAIDSQYGCQGAMSSASGEKKQNDDFCFFFELVLTFPLKIPTINSSLRDDEII